MKIADADAGLRHVFLRDLVLEVSIGVHPHERGARQRIRINVDLGVLESSEPATDRLDRVVDYQAVANRVREVATARHVNLVETLAERIAAQCLVDERVVLARIRVEKLDVFADMESAGVEVERRRTALRPPESRTA
jgi:dihydroneopterin aldolase